MQQNIFNLFEGTESKRVPFKGCAWLACRRRILLAIHSMVNLTCRAGQRTLVPMPKAVRLMVVWP